MFSYIYGLSIVKKSSIFYRFMMIFWDFVLLRLMLFNTSGFLRIFHINLLTVLWFPLFLIFQKLVCSSYTCLKTWFKFRSKLKMPWTKLSLNIPIHWLILKFNSEHEYMSNSKSALFVFNKTLRITLRITIDTANSSLYYSTFVSYHRQLQTTNI